MRILLIGGGGREHALAAALAAAPSEPELHCAPGNPGVARLARCHPISPVDVGAVVALARDVRPDLVVVGPEAPLVAGVADALREAGVAVFGPGAESARLEGSKAFAKDVMRAAGVPTARSFTVATAPDADAAIAALEGRVVVKADGLAAGKGVVVCADEAEARGAARRLLDGALGDAGARLVIEERLEGPELSLLALCDGTTAVPLPPARDHKRLGDGDVGPNTGGMGAYSPVPGLDAAAVADLLELVHRPVLRELERRGTPFSGCLYAGLMLTPDGVRVLEFNVRFGDPEAQAVLPLLRGDLTGRLYDAATGRLTPDPVEVEDGAAVAVVLAAPGYPDAVESGAAIEGLDEPDDPSGDTHVFHAGTAIRDGRVVTAGGRVLAVTGLGSDLEAARRRAYARADRIRFPGLRRRSDIAAAVRPAAPPDPAARG